MKIGAMNHPGLNPYEEIVKIIDQGFDFVDFTHEPPSAHITMGDAFDLRSKTKNFPIVGHTAFYLPIATEYEGIFKASINTFKESVRIFNVLQAKFMTIHYDKGQTVTNQDQRLNRHLKVLKEISSYVKENNFSVEIMLENDPSAKNQLKDFRTILDSLPDVYLHLDIAHAWVTGGMAEIEGFLDLGQNGRLKHVHISENDGITDQHMPLWTNFRNPPPWKDIISLLKSSGYDETITLEIFSPDSQNRIHSKDILRKLWMEAG